MTGTHASTGAPAPNARQWAAIRAVDRHVLVEAGAGTGKTFTVVRRLLYQLGVPVAGETAAQAIALDEVAAITFTTAAAAELKEKLRDALRAAGRRDLAFAIPDARIGTIHGFCRDILGDLALRTGQPLALDVLEPAEARSLVREVAQDTIIDALDRQGIGALFADRSLSEVIDHLVALASEPDRLRRIARHAADHRPAEQELIAIAQQVVARVDERLAASASADLDRLLTRTRDLLREHDDARRALQRHLKLLVIDEFQDVDPVQQEIAELIAEPATHRRDTPRLLLVGDPKQSIYRFRRADVTIWRAVAETFKANPDGCAVVALEESRRSVPPLLALVDTAIGPLLNAPVNGTERQAYEVDYLPLTATRPAQDTEPVVELGVVEDDTLKAEARRRAEAAWIAQRFAELHEQEGRPWRDMAILLPARAAMPLYQAALAARNIPSYASGGSGFFSAPEIVDLQLALSVLRDPANDLTLVGFLRAPFAALRDETLLALTLQGEGSLWSRLQEGQRLEGIDAGDLENLGRAVRTLQELVPLRDRVPTHDLLQRLLDKTGYVAHLVAMGDRQQALANIRQFLQFARAHGNKGVGELLRLVTELREQGDDTAEATLFGPGEDVVTITTIHSAKGLEWGVVAWADLSRTRMPVSGDLLVGRDRLALQLEEDGEPEGNEEAPGPWQALKVSEQAEEDAEMYRRHYVAATRARDRLLLVGFAEGSASAVSPSQQLRGALPVFGHASGAPIPLRSAGGEEFAALYRAIPAVDAPEPAPTAVPSVAELLARLPVPAPVHDRAGIRRQHSATSLMGHERCARRHWYRYALHLKEPSTAAPGARRGEMAAQVAGQIVHDVLERQRDAESIDALLDIAIAARDPEAPAAGTRGGDALREHLRAEVRAALATPEYRALLALPHARRELAFTWLLDDGIALEGAMDLVALEGSASAILDVKTSRLSPGEESQVAEAYALQRDVYVAAMQAIGGPPVERFLFHFTRTATAHAMPLDAAARAAAEKRVKASLASLRVRPPALAADAATCRFCGYREAGWCAGVTSA